MTPFEYPTLPHERWHGPAGYLDTDSFRPWLRDEFVFRCVYCLRREQWAPGQTGFEIDHLAAVVNAPELALTYDNLMYTCEVCNSVKGARDLPDPSRELVAGALAVAADGTIIGFSRRARRIIRVLGLDDAEFTLYRARWIKIVALAKEHDADLYRQLLGFPDDLPDLRSLRPPGGNTRPNGIKQSHFCRREKGELPPIY
ncbi:MAG TPA: HNH endonuclease [Gemmataceae bacterium]|nr:HNH endonuclease [Gemmataceae bacterium]